MILDSRGEEERIWSEQWQPFVESNLPFISSWT